MESKIKKMLFVGLGLAVVCGIFFFKYIFQDNFRYAGTLEATYVDIAARLAAAIKEIKVREGNKVTAGEVLITFACEDFKINAKLAKENYERNMQLFKEKAIPANIMDSYQSQLDSTQTKVSWCTLSSPISGKVITRYREPGEWVMPGTKILTLANIQDIWAYIYVPQPQVAKLTLGMKLKGYLPELNNREYAGEIVKISDEAEFTPKNVQTREERERLIYRVKISFYKVNIDEILKPGMTIEIMLPQ